MPCACGSKTGSNQTWTVVSPNGGKPKVYSSEVEAKAEAQRTGGTARRS